MKFDFVPVDYDYVDIEGKNYIQLIGRTAKGEKVCIIDTYEPNFWVILKKEYEQDAGNLRKRLEKISVKRSSRISKVTRTETVKKNYLGKPVTAIQIFITNHKDAQDIASEIGEAKEIEVRREYDINIITKYIKEKSIEPCKYYEVDADLLTLDELGGIASALEVGKCFLAKKISKSQIKKEFVPKVLAYDIETDGFEMGKNHILSIAIYGDDFKKVLTWKGSPKSLDYVEKVESESDMIEAFAKCVNEEDPDILTGYFSDGFDLPFLKTNAIKKKATFDIGLDRKGPVFSRGRIQSGKIKGIVHVDIFRFIDAVFSQYLTSETLSLREVSNELVGESKGDFDFNKIGNMTEEDWRDLFKYNLQDANVTHKLFEKIWPDILEFGRIVKEPIFNVTRNRMSAHVENHIIHNLDRFNEIAEKRPLGKEIATRRARERFEGAYVYEPTPGLYENIVMFDFTSMHASIIVSFNISKATLSEDPKNCNETPKFDLEGKSVSFCFGKKQGFFSELLAEVVEKRKKYKKEYSENKNAMTKARSNAYKLLANATFGYQGFFGARYYSIEAAASTLAFVRKFMKETIEKIRDEGYEILYGDTDSIAFLQGKKTKKQVLDFLEKINGNLPGIMELDLEDFYKRGLFVSTRSGTAGAKKKYALLDEKDKLKIRGFETVRRDWCKLSRNLQNEILNEILKTGNEKTALELLKKQVDALKNRSVSPGDLIIKTKLRRPLGEYKSKGPHVIAAEKMKAKGKNVTTGMIVEYYIGQVSSKAKKIGDKVFLPDEKAKYDIKYYLNNQILPAAENIFEVFDISVRDVAEGSSQKKLF
jgi:DNA polymerase elongation subunit (family B)